jgi:hypothetical protein
MQLPPCLPSSRGLTSINDFSFLGLSAFLPWKHVMISASFLFGWGMHLHGWRLYVSSRGVFGLTEMIHDRKKKETAMPEGFTKCFCAHRTAFVTVVCMLGQFLARSASSFLGSLSHFEHIFSLPAQKYHAIRRSEKQLHAFSFLHSCLASFQM